MYFSPPVPAIDSREEWRSKIQDGYRIVCFKNFQKFIPVNTFLSTRSIDPSNHGHRVNDDVLRWHLRQCILTNMKGAGQVSWEDYDDMDIMGRIMQGPDAAERMEVELFGRLGMGDPTGYQAPRATIQQYHGGAENINEHSDEEQNDFQRTWLQIEARISTRNTC